jgi:hypothetical protein
MKEQKINKKTFLLATQLSCSFEKKPTQSLMLKWLREEHKISVKVDDYQSGFKVFYDVNMCKLGSQDDNPEGQFSTYEKALEYGLKKTLKLIIKKNEHQNKI